MKFILHIFWLFNLVLSVPYERGDDPYSPEHVDDFYAFGTRMNNHIQKLWLPQFLKDWANRAHDHALDIKDLTREKGENSPHIFSENAPHKKFMREVRGPPNSPFQEKLEGYGRVGQMVSKLIRALKYLFENPEGKQILHDVENHKIFKGLLEWGQKLVRVEAKAEKLAEDKISRARSKIRLEKLQRREKEKNMERTKKTVKEKQE